MAFDSNFHIISPISFVGLMQAYLLNKNLVKTLASWFLRYYSNMEFLLNWCQCDVGLVKKEL